MIGRASRDSKAEVAWKYYPTQVCLKYGVKLVGYPCEDICDPSNLTVNELFALRESLQKGTCSFKRLSECEKGTLQLRVEEQEQNGENPWGKRKRQDNTHKPKKKRKILESTVLSSTNPHPPSEISTSHPIQDMYLAVPSDSDSDSDNGYNSDNSDNRYNNNTRSCKATQMDTRKVANPAVCGNV